MIGMVIQTYIFIIIIRSIISWAGPMPYNPFVQILRKLTDPVFRFVHKNFPFTIIGGIDLSPIVVIFILYFLNNFFTGILNDYALSLLKYKEIIR
jgi:YggT family protein